MTPWREVPGRLDAVLLTFDALRYDVAQSTWRAGHTPNLARHLPPEGWEARDTNGTFTLPAHQAFFAGFLPTPQAPGRHRRSIALRFQGSETIGPETLVFAAPSIVAGFADAGHHTICVGGTGFFNPETPLGAVLPSMFAEAHYDRSLGVADPRSPKHQVARACAALKACPSARRVFLFVNFSATHPPTRIFAPGATSETKETQAAALAALDRALPALFEALAARGGARVIACADHGTCFGEDGRVGHRFAHPLVTTVPYAEFEVQR